jgi:(1->4)-alpha-D-glucan 1-alpha-D-glucosylmutase
MNLNLVDPDNRRLVDYEKRKKLIRKIQETSQIKVEPFPEPADLMETADRLKLFLIMKGLKARKRNYGLFLDGSYIPLKITGRFSRHVVAFARRTGKSMECYRGPPIFSRTDYPPADPVGIGYLGRYSRCFAFRRTRDAGIAF